MAASPILAPAPPRLAPAEGLHLVADRYDVLLCDLWGVMHDGRAAFGEAVEATRRFRAKGGTVVFITNAPRPHEPVLDQIARLGVTPDAFDGIVTSGDVTIEAVAAEGGRPIHHIGPLRDHALFEAVRRRTGVAPRLAGLDEAELVVVTGLFDDLVETPRDYADRFAAMRERNLTMICANPDIIVHIGETLIYCGGALAQAYEALGGRVIMAGKPHPPIYAAALAIAARVRGAPTPPARVLAIGDGLPTDGAGAAAAGLDFLLVTSGIHREAFHPDPAMPLDAVLYAEQVAGLAHPSVAALRHLRW